MNRANRFISCLLGAGLVLSTGSGLQACAFHGYTPNPTLVDDLLNTEQAILARPDPADNSSYSAIATLLGPPVAEVPLRVSPAIRAELTADPTTTVLLARDGAYGPWREIAVLDAEFRATIEQVITRQSAWLAGRDQDRQRLFVAGLNARNPDLRRLALQELDRLDYRTLRQAKLPALPSLRQDLSSGDADLLPIRVLLAGLSGDTSFAASFSAQLESAVQRDLPYLGAYATALIELQGEAAVRHITDTFLAPDTLSWGAREKLIEALAIQYRGGDREIRRTISHEIAVLSRRSPGLAEAAARQFGTTNRWQSQPPSAIGQRVDR